MILSFFLPSSDVTAILDEKVLGIWMFWSVNWRYSLVSSARDKEQSWNYILFITLIQDSDFY